MLMLRETKFQTWRALALSEAGKEHLIVLGNSSEQVKRNYAQAFSEVLTVDEQSVICKISLEKWNGVADCGKWANQDFLKVPQPVSVVEQMT